MLFINHCGITNHSRQGTSYPKQGLCPAGPCCRYATGLKPELDLVDTELATKNKVVINIKIAGRIFSYMI